jgi:dipeptidyl aminopeptidase/acylaminoacyl peptidase
MFTQYAAAQNSSISYVVKRNSDSIAIETITNSGDTSVSQLNLNKLMTQTIKFIRDNTGKTKFVISYSQTYMGYQPSDTTFLKPHTGNQHKRIASGLIYFERSILSLQTLVWSAMTHKKTKIGMPFFRVSTKKEEQAYFVFSQGHKVRVTIGNLTFKLKIDQSGTIESGCLPELGIKFNRTNGVPKMFLNNPYVSSSRLYSSKEINFVSNHKDTLSGTFNIPSQGSKHPAYIIITGLSQTNRNGGGPPHAPLYQLADALGKKGIATLRIDDRGTNKSTGVWAGSNMFDEAADIENAIDWLKTQHEIDSAKIGLIGWSEGAVIAPMLGAKRNDLHSLILMAAMGTDGMDLATYQISSAIEESYEPGPRKDSIINAEIEAAKKESPKMKSLIEYDALLNADLINMPVLMLHGTKDKHVSEQQARIFFKRLKLNNDKTTFKVFKNINHIWLPDNRGQATYWPFLQSFTIPSEILNVITSWATKQNK